MLLGFKVMIVAAGVLAGQYPLAALPDGVQVPVTQVYDAGLGQGAWVAERVWDDAAEEEFAAFVETIGLAREEKVFRLAQGLRNPAINPLYTEEDAEIRFEADCATFAYALRAYFAYKTRRPFSYIANKGRRYRYGNRPRQFGDHTQYNEFSTLLRRTMSSVSSGHFRMHAALEGTDTYPVEITAEAIRPGVTYYDPGGHVLVVYRVDRVTGDVYMMDGHPDGTVTLKTFSYRMPRGSRRSGGGFRAWRHYDLVPLDVQEGSFMITRQLNRDAPYYSDIDQFRNEYSIAGKKVSYHEYVKAQVRNRGPLLVPLAGFEERLDRICASVASRQDEVERALEQGWTVAPVLGKTPRKVFWGLSAWHDFNTAAEDIRLRHNVMELETFVHDVLEMARLRDPELHWDGSSLALEAALVAEFERVASRENCSLTYTNTAGEAVDLSLRQVLARMTAISFDPYHCPERRWGALPGSAEYATCIEDGPRQESYRTQSKLRRRVRMHSRTPAPRRHKRSSRAAASTSATLFGI